ncbi:hypothetical protein D3C78_1701350 [compost metagenome]
MVNFPLGNRQESDRITATAITEQHPLTDQGVDRARYVCTLGNGLCFVLVHHLRDVQRSHLHCFLVVTCGKTVDCQGYTKLTPRQVGRNQRLIQIVFHPGKPPG